MWVFLVVLEGCVSWCRCEEVWGGWVGGLLGLDGVVFVCFKSGGLVLVFVLGVDGWYLGGM